MPIRPGTFAIRLFAFAAAVAAGSALAAQAPSAKRIRIVAVGDVIPHDTVLRAFRDPRGGYDFKPAFRFVKPDIESADLAICNFETVVSGKGSYSGYPDFDSPESLAAALADAGFDVAVTANNHLMDQGVRGLDGTIDALRRSGLAVAGTRKPGEPRYALVERAGFKVAIVAYAFAAYDKQGRLGFNSIPMPPQAATRINYYVEKELQAGIAEIRASVAAARQAGADIVVAFYHWGEEYDLSPRPVQVALAQASADMGVDLVFGSHPHVLQRVDMLRPAQAPEREVPVFYSLGNFLSNQRRDTVDNRLTEDGVIASATFEKADGAAGPVLASANAVATWVDKSADPLAYAVIPLDVQCMLNPLVAGRGLSADVQASLAATKAALGKDAFSESLMLFTFHQAVKP